MNTFKGITMTIYWAIFFILQPFISNSRQLTTFAQKGHYSNLDCIGILNVAHFLCDNFFGDLWTNVPFLTKTWKHYKAGHNDDDKYAKRYPKANVITFASLSFANSLLAFIFCIFFFKFVGATQPKAIQAPNH